MQYNVNTGLSKSNNNIKNMVQKNSAVLSIIFIVLLFTLIWLIGKMLGFDWSVNRFYHWLMGEKILEEDNNGNNDESDDDDESDDEDEPVETAPIRLKKEVYNISPNIYGYHQADKVCKAQDPPAELASLGQVINAYKSGGEWCNYGWSKDQLALYPTQKSTYNEDRLSACGYPGINGGFFRNPNLKFGVNCYGVKRNPDGDEVERYDDDKIEDIDNDIAYGNVRINPFNKEKWSGVKK
jgi:hypothetical protein